MNELLDLIKLYTIKKDCKIQKICTPLVDHLGIPYFSYYFIEEDGRFGILSNCVEFMDYYYTKQMYLHNPYMADPGLFRSGYVLSPCAFDNETQQTLKQRYLTNHLFLTLRRSEKKVEGFIFADVGFNKESTPRYVANLDLLIKFGQYFKREAGQLIGRLRADRFNMQKARGEAFLHVEADLPLSNNNQKERLFLKSIYGLSPQEERCLELFKQGHSAQATAAIMDLSRRTVETYFEQIKQKLGCRSKRDLLQS